MNDMDTFTATLMITCIISVAILAWTYTKPGKKWLDDL